MNDIMIFNNEEFGKIRTVEIDNEVWFVASDICKSLEIANTTQAVQKLEADEKSMLNIGLSGGATNCINEYGLYSLVLTSRKPEAKKFKHWVTHEVLPSIRKTGGYRIPHTVGGQIQLLAQGYTELAQEVHEFKEEVNTKIDKLENDIPLYGCEMEEITQHVKRKVVTILGGKDSAAYRNKSIRNSVFADIYRQLKREYGAVSTYKSIKRKYIADAHEFIDCYAVPRVIEDEITEANSQVKLSV
jgi:prophage antirepressor-like protein